MIDYEPLFKKPEPPADEMARLQVKDKINSQFKKIQADIADVDENFIKEYNQKKITQWENGEFGDPKERSLMAHLLGQESKSLSDNAAGSQ